MKLQDKVLYMSFGAGLVVLGMILNSLINNDANARGRVEDATFGTITCRDIIIKDGYKEKAHFGLAPNGSAILAMYGDDQIYKIAYLGENTSANNEMMLLLRSKSKTDRREAMIMIDGNGGRVDCRNKMGGQIVGLGVADDGGHLGRK
ncbi:hypothetical protein CMK10_15275 [Candidatus Poribacteria bacterium]|jgi:hypothetical protein|uniref:Uncharacterized protein n=1 Tax=marine metagenome TaxID=408172 RepID=A0A382HCE0_9ZZZZ|nr:hypothetical protein [Candidatus Poribacteria bacterium]|tara:strand:+ start:218 stop:661 length:444 start_codon:yes stop_codon:yes gene_type:complete